MRSIAQSGAGISRISRSAHFASPQRHRRSVRATALARNPAHASVQAKAPCDLIGSTI